MNLTKLKKMEKKLNSKRLNMLDKNLTMTFEFLQVCKKLERVWTKI